MDIRKTTISATLIAGALIVIPALAQNNTSSPASSQTGTAPGSAMDGLYDDEETPASSPQPPASSEVGAEEDEDTGTGQTQVPNELPETGGGWGSL